jgi:predicted nucleic acid-binding protein
LTVYADSSFLVSLYVTDRHSANARQRVSAASRVWFTPLHLAECTHAIAQQVFRRDMSATEGDQVYREFEDDRAAGLWTAVDIPENAFDICAELARRHGAKFGVRTLDSLHVACALELKAERFWTFDDRQLKLARASGLKTSA